MTRVHTRSRRPPLTGAEAAAAPTAAC
jgi:hypothetical protein